MLNSIYVKFINIKGFQIKAFNIVSEITSFVILAAFSVAANIATSSKASKLADWGHQRECPCLVGDLVTFLLVLCNRLFNTPEQ